MTNIPARNTPTDAERRRVASAARVAADAGTPITVCPFDPNGTPRERILALTWVREYLDAQIEEPAVDYGDDEPV